MRTRLLGKLEGDLQSLDCALLETLFDQVGDTAFFVKDGDGLYTVVNQSLVERHGLRLKSEMLGKRPSDVAPGVMGEAFDEQDRMILQTGKPIVGRLELHWYAPNSAGWCLTTKIPILRDGKAFGIVGISKDVRIPVSRSQIPPGVAKALTYLGEHFDEITTPETLAKTAGVNSRRLAHILKRVFGLTPSQMILKTRIGAACRLLRETKVAVAVVSQRCGYQDQSAFTRAFRSAMGITPKQYREQFEEA